MRNIKEELREDLAKKYQSDIAKNQRVVKTIAITGIVVASLYASRYIIYALAETVKACKSLGKAIKS